MTQARLGKIRLDRLLVERGFADSCQKAQALILAGQVLVNEQKIEKCGILVEQEADIRLLSGLAEYVGRGGIKLEGAVDHFQVDIEGKRCLDIGASTGGFTDCLLRRGAARVYAVDVGTNQLDWQLRRDPRVVVLEKTNARYLSPEQIGAKVHLVTMDVSFISATLILPVVPALLSPGAEVLVLVKPQFELSPEQVGKGGVVRETQFHQEAISKVSLALEQLGFQDIEPAASVLTGASGNQEYFLHAIWRKNV